MYLELTMSSYESCKKKEEKKEKKNPLPNETSTSLFIVFQSDQMFGLLTIYL